MRALGVCLFTLVVALLCLVGPSAIGQQAESKSPQHPYVHTVIFYLKKDAPHSESGLLIRDCHKILAKIPTVHGLRAGQPAEKATPKVAVKDYAVALTIMFDDAKGLQTYLDHPLHIEFVQKHEKYLERVLVYDFADQAK